MNEIFLIQIKAKKLCHLKFFFEGEELMMRMKEGHTEMETISPTDTGNEGIKFVFKHGTKLFFFFKPAIWRPQNIKWWPGKEKKNFVEY